MTKKQYAAVDQYEEKLPRVMKRLGIEDYDFNWDRSSAWIRFCYKGRWYQFDHSADQSRRMAEGNKRVKVLTFGTDCFAKLVLNLEKLAGMVEDGIYDLSNYVEGMKFLPPAVEIPSFFQYLGFTQIPASPEEVKKRYRALAKTMHSDVGGSEEDFQRLKQASDQAFKYFEARI